MCLQSVLKYGRYVTLGDTDLINQPCRKQSDIYIYYGPFISPTYFVCIPFFFSLMNEHGTCTFVFSYLTRQTCTTNKILDVLKLINKYIVIQIMLNGMPCYQSLATFFLPTKHGVTSSVHSTIF